MAEIPSKADAAGKYRRIPYLDWLRVTAMLVLVFFHTARIFDSLSPFYIKNGQTLVVFNNLIIFVNQWELPVFFLIAGSATWFSLEIRSAGRYLKERFYRLLVPFFFGILVVVPPQLYFVLRTSPGYHSSYWKFLSSYFFNIDPSYPLGGNYSGAFEVAHLWFLGVLFVFSLVLLPFFLTVKKDEAKEISAGNLNGGHLAALAVPIVLITVLTHALLDWSFLQNPFIYFIFFIYGFLLFAIPRINKAIAKNRNFIFAAGFTTTLLLFFLLSLGWNRGVSGTSILGMPALNQKIIYEVVNGFNMWFLMLSLLYLGQKYLNFYNKLLSYLNGAVLPVYILHQTFIVVFGFYIIRWSLNIAQKYSLIVFSSLAASLLLYELVIKRTNLTRFLFGMRLKK